MAFKVQWHEDMEEDFATLDKVTARKIVKRVNEYLAQDPLKLGKPLTGQFTGLYRYRYGDFRIIYVIDIEEETFMVLKVRHRKNVYREDS